MVSTAAGHAATTAHRDGDRCPDFGGTCRSVGSTPRRSRRTREVNSYGSCRRTAGWSSRRWSPTVMAGVSRSRSGTAGRPGASVPELGPAQRPGDRFDRGDPWSPVPLAAMFRRTRSASSRRHDHARRPVDRTAPARRGEPPGAGRGRAGSPTSPAPTTSRSDSDGVRRPPPVGGLHDGHGLDDVSSERVRVAATKIRHRSVGASSTVTRPRPRPSRHERAPRRGVPATHHHADSARAADPGDAGPRSAPDP